MHLISLSWPLSRVATGEKSEELNSFIVSEHDANKTPSPSEPRELSRRPFLREISQVGRSFRAISSNCSALSSFNFFSSFSTSILRGLKATRQFTFCGWALNEAIEGKSTSVLLSSGSPFAFLLLPTRKCGERSQQPANAFSIAVPARHTQQFMCLDLDSIFQSLKHCNKHIAKKKFYLSSFSLYFVLMHLQNKIDNKWTMRKRKTFEIRFQNGKLS